MFIIESTNNYEQIFLPLERMSKTAQNQFITVQPKIVTHLAASVNL